MKALEEKIRKEGIVMNGDVLKVGSFLNHQIDVPFMEQCGQEFYRLYRDEGVNKILTIEASGIGVACLSALYFKTPVVFAKKNKSKNLTPDVYTVPIESYTHGTTYDVMVEKRFLTPADRILILDDFLARGNALQGLIKMVEMSGASLAGCGIVIEKAYQGGGDRLRSQGIRVESLARIASMNALDGVTFVDE
ncbi:MAG: xanthine phosphoribosyltransferase [Oscillospiraceae bacterium]|nr:xanthine phosphoribosyltransferase [Oscillospiraceae bacterium]